MNYISQLNLYVLIYLIMKIVKHKTKLFVFSSKSREIEGRGTVVYFEFGSICPN